MITLQDLDAAIAECQGERNPNSNICMKLAAFYTIKEQMFGHPNQEDQSFGGASFSPPPMKQSNTIQYDSGTEFSEVIDGRDLDDILPVIDELMSVLQATNPRLYDGVMRKIEY